MNCRDWNKSLPSLLDADPESPDRRRLEAHLSRCPECRGSWALLARLRSEARELDGLEPGEAVWQGIQDRLSGRPEARSSPTGLGWLFHGALRWAPAAALGALSLAAVWLWSINRPAPLREPPHSSATIVPSFPATQVSMETAANPPRAARRASSARPRRSPAEGLASHRTRNYVIDVPASSGEILPGEDRTQYLMPALLPQQSGSSAGQQYVMPAVYIADREPF